MTWKKRRLVTNLLILLLLEKLKIRNSENSWIFRESSRNKQSSKKWKVKTLKNSGKVRKINKFSKNWNLKLWILSFHGYFSFCRFLEIISAEIEIRRFHSLEILDLFWFWIGQWKLSDLKFKRSDWLLNFQKRKQNSVYLTGKFSLEKRPHHNSKWVVGAQE